MRFPSWLQNRTVTSKRRPVNRFRPQLEVLEDRAVPATFTVNTTLDVLGNTNGMLSLRQAIIDANATPKKADTIVLPAGNYTLTRAGESLSDGGLTGDLDITAPLTINGAGAGSTVVNAAGLNRVFFVHSTTVTLAGMTIEGGVAAIAGTSPWPNYGGGIYNSGSLTVNSCAISGNSAAYLGGGIFNGGTLTVSNSTLSGNSARYGGGIYNYQYETVTVQSSNLSGNTADQGGGIYNGPWSTATVQYSSLSDNSATFGGAIFNNEYGTFTVSSGTLSGNTSPWIGGAIFNGGTMKVVDSTLSGNSASYRGGGINNNDVGTLTISSSTVLNNTAPYGADLYNSDGWVSISKSAIGVIGP